MRTGSRGLGPGQIAPLLGAALLPKGRVRHHGRVDLTPVVVVVAVAVLASTTQGLTGFGFALIALPFFLLVLDVQEAVVLAVMLSTVGLILVVTRTFRRVPWGTVSRLLMGSFIGMPVGLAVLLFAPADALRIGVGVAVIVMAAALALGVRIASAGLPAQLGVGATSGVLWTSTSMSGPPVVLYLQGRGLEPMEFRAALVTYFLVGNTISIGAFFATGVVTARALVLAACALPAIFIGNWSGSRLVTRVEPALFRRVVLLVLVATALSSIGASVQRLVG